MNRRLHFILCLPAAWLLLAAAGSLPLRAVPPPQPAKTEVKPPVSHFVIPDNPSQGRDPFFPDSMRVYASSPGNKAHGPVPTGLSLKSILGDPPQVFAIINNHTFAAGDEGDVITDSGQRLHIHCLDVDPETGTATVEAEGMTEVLHLSGGL